MTDINNDYREAEDFEDTTDYMQELAHEMMSEIIEQREKILEAFIAETGLKPSECEQVFQGNKWWVQKRT